jgi:hypothetical protein
MVGARRGGAGLRLLPEFIAHKLADQRQHQRIGRPGWVLATASHHPDRRSSPGPNYCRNFSASACATLALVAHAPVLRSPPRVTSVDLAFGCKLPVCC